ncbi:NAD-dependent epimerase/dehydratase family protein [Kovacikia minuta CCNUW1]|uniref:NAD-dependent epimerase/dehydratase family protein n=1 Tax=Kovacikia minuta TaxID=2931930 RepID=UPI001CC9DA86|nr:NAD-dependent epimerase/dehydratase family protein [Kovacikia minuta]UBF28350.1 NAD-dependent epimerase/dehydratase family protein [Kovacikia minuta CCNUW1]
MKTAQDVIDADLQYICSNLKSEFAQMAGKKLLIVGGAGFLGYYLVQSVLHWNETDGTAPIQLTVYDNYIRGIPDWLTKLKDNPNLTLAKHDITHPLPADIEDFQYIIHAASIASPTYYRKYPIETMDANVNGLRILLDYCQRQKAAGKPVEGFLFFSTSEIYGDPSPENIPTPETYRGNVSCTGPRACYDESKRYGETLCVNFAQQHDLPIKIARPFNNYGPGLKVTDKRVLPDYVRDVLAGRDIVMLSDGSPTRTFCYIADAIAGYYKVLVTGRPGEAYNIGTETPEISMATLADKVVAVSRELFGYTGKVVRQVSEDQAYLIDNPNRRCPVIAKARSELGYDPCISVDDGLQRALIWYQENREAEEA